MPTLLLLLAAAAAEPAPPPECNYDRAAMLALELQAFDQNLGGGWRKLGDAGCYVEAADLLRDWREAHRAAEEPFGFILFWHEGQMRAFAGQSERAIALFDLSRKPEAEDARFGWNLYVDGSIAFLRRDKRALEEARAKLAVLPKPADWAPIGVDGKALNIAWPQNLNILDGFLRCWEQPYSTAYGCPESS